MFLPISTALLPIAFAPATRVGAFSVAYANALPPIALLASTALPPYSNALAPAAFAYGVAAVTALPPYSNALAPTALAAGSATAPSVARPRNKGPPSIFAKPRRGDNAKPKTAAKALKGPFTIIPNALANPNSDDRNPFSSFDFSFLSSPSEPTCLGFFPNILSYLDSLAASSCFSSRVNCFSSSVSWSLKSSS